MRTVKVLRVGLDGTDKEINAAEYGAAPTGDDFLILGHESFGQVEAVGSNVTELKPGDYVVATVRRPGSSIYDQIGTNDSDHRRCLPTSVASTCATAFWRSTTSATRTSLSRFPKVSSTWEFCWSRPRCR